MSDVTTHVPLELRGSRVDFVLRDGSRHHGIFRHVKPNGYITLADEKGFLTEFDPHDVERVEDRRSVCTRCSGIVNNVFDDPELCAECYRDDAYERRKHEHRVFEELCSVCGVKGAIFSPKAKEFRCPPCHLAKGSMTGLGAETRAMASLAACRTADVSDPMHQWVRIRGRRFRCRLCHVDKYGD